MPLVRPDQFYRTDQKTVQLAMLIVGRELHHRTEVDPCKTVSCCGKLLWDDLWGENVGTAGLRDAGFCGSI